MELMEKIREKMERAEQVQCDLEQLKRANERAYAGRTPKPKAPKAHMERAELAQCDLEQLKRTAKWPTCSVKPDSYSVTCSVKPAPNPLPRSLEPFFPGRAATSRTR